MRVPGLAIAALLSVLACRREPPPPSEYERLERAAFAVDVPAKWKIILDEGRAGMGKHKRQRGADHSIAEVAWQGGEAASMDDMAAMVQAVLSGFALDGAIGQTETPSQLRVSAVANLLEQELRVVGAPSPAVGLGGVAQTRIRAVASATERPVAVATFLCPDSVQGYIALALDDGEGATDAAGLEALLDVVGCPGTPGGRSYRGACEVGAEAFCAASPAAGP